MQLYILDREPGRAVRSLADVHVIKMCLETMQIIAGVMNNAHLPPVPGMLKPYNPSHPVIRAVDSPAKLNWVLLYNCGAGIEEQQGQISEGKGVLAS